MDYIKLNCVQCGGIIYSGDFCSRVCEDEYSDNRIKFGAEGFEDRDIPSVDDVATKGAASFQRKSLLRENLIKAREDRQKAKVKIWEEMRRNSGVI